MGTEGLSLPGLPSLAELEAAINGAKVLAAFIDKYPLMIPDSFHNTVDDVVHLVEGFSQLLAAQPS